MINYLKFNSRSKEGKCLSNFSNHNIIINKKYFKTGEHCFHYMKYYYCSKKCEYDRKIKLKKYSKNFLGKNSIYNLAKDAKKAGGKKGLLLKNDELEDWDKTYSEKIQKKICKYKLKNYKEIKDILILNKNKILIHQDNFANENTIWGGKIKNNKIIGKNKLGIIWMNIRDNINKDKNKISL